MPFGFFWFGVLGLGFFFLLGCWFGGGSFVCVFLLFVLVCFGFFFIVTQIGVQKLLRLTSEMNLQGRNNVLGLFVSWDLWLHYTKISL